jgi:ferredoxin
MAESNLKIEIDREQCMGSGMCTVYAPETFDMDDEGKAMVIDPAGNSAEEIRTAAASCPTGAIILRTVGRS